MEKFEVVQSENSGTPNFIWVGIIIVVIIVGIGIGIANNLYGFTSRTTNSPNNSSTDLETNNSNTNSETNNSSTDSETNNSTNVHEDNTSNNNESSNSLNYGHLYTIAQVNNGKGKTLSSYIGFNRDGTCAPMFYSFNNCSISEEFCVFYQRTKVPCTYEMNNNIISVDWDGMFEIEYKYKLGTGASQKSLISRGYIMRGIQFEYYPDGDYIDTINGEWSITPGEYFTVDFKLN